MRKLVVVAGALVALGVAASFTVGALSAALTPGPSNRTVQTAGKDVFVPNARISSNLRFIPGDIKIRSGGTLTLQHSDDTEDPHTLTIVDADEVPGTLDDVFNCGAPDTVCDAVFTALGDSPAPFTEGSGTMPGIDGRLDTLAVNPGEAASAIVSAPSGTTLYYICAIHAWMQGRIIVE